mgnify:CR=1 FL=1
MTTPLARVGLILLASLSLCACGSQPLLIVDHDPTFDFATLKTYRWYDDVYPSKTSEYRQYNSSDTRIRHYVNRELEQRDYREVSRGTPDFLVNYSVSREEKMKVNSIAGYPSAGMHGGVGVGSYGSAVSLGYSSGPSVSTYREGTVIIDVIDASTRNIIWRSLAEGRLEKLSSHKDKDNRASKVAREMMTDFPPSPTP